MKCRDCNCDKDSRLVSDAGICARCRLPVLLTVPNWVTGNPRFAEFEKLLRGQQ